MKSNGTMPILPVEAYTSQDWFDREQDCIFSRTWAFAGLTEDVSEPGQYVAVQAGLNNIFIVMGEDGEPLATFPTANSSLRMKLCL